MDMNKGEPTSVNIVLKTVSEETVFNMEDIEDEHEDYYYGISGGTE